MKVYTPYHLNCSIPISVGLLVSCRLCTVLNNWPQILAERSLNILTKSKWKNGCEKECEEAWKEKQNLSKSIISFILAIPLNDNTFTSLYLCRSIFKMKIELFKLRFPSETQNLFDKWHAFNVKITLLNFIMIIKIQVSVSSFHPFINHLLVKGLHVCEWQAS